MASEKSTYLGPFLKVLVKPKKITETVNVNSSGKEYPLNVNFDPTTGEKLSLIEKKKIELAEPSPYIYDHPSLGEDMFIVPEYYEYRKSVNFLLNLSSLHIEEIEEVIFDVDIKKEMKLFEKDYADYLAYYKNECGYEFTIYYGIINY